ncbi:hypothetical protein Lal_00011873 [Lupinus albus]|nr:hypothetical protein Lal_00011873 [Lupinus albus]
MGILIQTTSLLYIFPSSISFSVSTRVGNKLGATKARLSTIVGLSCSFMCSECHNSFGFFFYGLCELGNRPQTIGCGVLRGTARHKVGANINLGCFYLVGMPVAIY